MELFVKAYWVKNGGHDVEIKKERASIQSIRNMAGELALLIDKLEKRDCGGNRPSFIIILWSGWMDATLLSSS